MDHLSLVGIVPWEFVAQIANLLIQAALFKKFLFKPVQGIIAKRRGEVNAIYGEAEAARTAAEEEKAEYDRLMRDARVEAGQIVKALPRMPSPRDTADPVGAAGGRWDQGKGLCRNRPGKEKNSQ